MIFEYDDFNYQPNYRKEFSKNSVIQVNKIISKNICKNALNYFLNNEANIIKKYNNDSVGLVLDDVEGASFIKYFEFPLAESFKVFGPFINNDLFQLAQFLLDSPVYLRSMEIHTRGKGSTEIPPHQDNGYYGLKNYKALTMYIALNPQSADSGGLTYITNRQGREFMHKPTSTKAFSLFIEDKNLPKEQKHFCPNYTSGDCTIHHSHSIHYAKEVTDFASNRSIVVRLTFFATDSETRLGHEDWYKNMVKSNREKVDD